jgi:ribonuclease E
MEVICQAITEGLSERKLEKEKEASSAPEAKESGDNSKKIRPRKGIKGEEKPEVEAAPVAVAAAPVAVEEASAVVAETPAAVKEAPAVVEAAPVVVEEAPAVEEAAPAAEPEVKAE